MVKAEGEEAGEAADWGGGARKEGRKIGKSASAGGSKRRPEVGESFDAIAFSSVPRLPCVGLNSRCFRVR